MTFGKAGARNEQTSEDINDTKKKGDRDRQRFVESRNGQHQHKHEGEQTKKQQHPGTPHPGEGEYSDGNQQRGPVIGEAEVDDLETGPESDEQHCKKRLRHRRQGPGEPERTQTPEQQRIRVMFVDVVNLCDEPDTGPKHHRAQNVQAFDQSPVGRVTPRNPQGAAVTCDQPGKHHRELQELGMSAQL